MKTVPAPVNFLDSGSLPIERFRGDGGRLPCHGRRDRHLDRRADAVRFGSDSSTLRRQRNTQRQSKRRRALSRFAAVGFGPSRANAGASERAARSPENLNFNSRARGANLRGVLTGPRFSLGYRCAPALPRAARILRSLLGPLFLLARRTPVPAVFLSHVLNSVSTAVRCWPPRRRATGNLRSRHAFLLPAGGRRGMQ